MTLIASKIILALTTFESNNVLLCMIMFASSFTIKINSINYHNHQPPKQVTTLLVFSQPFLFFRLTLFGIFSLIKRKKSGAALPQIGMLLEITVTLVIAVAFKEIFAEFQEIVIHNSLTNFFHQVDKEVKVMIACQTKPKGFISFKQVTNVSTCVIATCVAITIMVKWCEIFCVSCIF